MKAKRKNLSPGALLSHGANAGVLASTALSVYDRVTGKKRRTRTPKRAAKARNNPFEGQINIPDGVIDRLGNEQIDAILNAENPVEVLENMMQAAIDENDYWAANDYRDLLAAVYEAQARALQNPSYSVHLEMPSVKETAEVTAFSVGGALRKGKRRLKSAAHVHPKWSVEKNPVVGGEVVWTEGDPDFDKRLIAIDVFRSDGINSRALFKNTTKGKVWHLLNPQDLTEEEKEKANEILNQFISYTGERLAPNPLRHGARFAGSNIRELHHGKQYQRTKKRYGEETAHRQAIAAGMSAAGVSRNPVNVLFFPNGDRFTIEHGKVAQSNAWERIYDYVREGYFLTESGGPATYGHTDFIWTGKTEGAIYHTISSDEYKRILEQVAADIAEENPSRKHKRGISSMAVLINPVTQAQIDKQQRLFEEREAELLRLARMDYVPEAKLDKKIAAAKRKKDQAYENLKRMRERYSYQAKRNPDEVYLTEEELRALQEAGQIYYIGGVPHLIKSEKDSFGDYTRQYIPVVIIEYSEQRNPELDQTFELNGIGYRTDLETLDVLRGIIPAARETGDSSAVIAVIELGKETGRIEEIISFEDKNPRGKIKRNMSAATKSKLNQVSEMFHGPNNKLKGKISQYYISDHVKARNYSRAGDLPAVKLLNDAKGKHSAPNHWCEDCALLMNPRTSKLGISTGKKVQFMGSGVHAVGKRLKNKLDRMNPEELSELGIKREGEGYDLGKIDTTVYQCFEKWSNNNDPDLINHFHEWAEETKRVEDKPNAKIDEKGMLYLHGNKHTVTKRGIEN